MSVLLIRLSGPMQSWGSRSRFTERDTEREPTKSGVLGLIGAALGRSREASFEDLAALRMGVRVDREGTVRRDYQTAGGGTWLGKPYGVARADASPITWRNMNKATVPSNRYYLADAVFLVGLESGDRALLARVFDVLGAPVWPLFLGRRSYVPAEPVRLPGGLVDDTSLEQALGAWPSLVENRSRHARQPDQPRQVRLVLECLAGEEGEPRQDVPISFRHNARLYGLRQVRQKHIELPATTEENAPCT